MDRRTFMIASATMALPNIARAQSAPTRIVFWHSMTAVLGEEVNRLCDTFNSSQSAIQVQPLFRGGYAESMTAAIAAWRAGQAPHLVQVFEVGTGSMLGAGPAVRQIWELSQETGIDIDPAVFIPAVRGYYSLTDGRLASMPFNSSTAVMFYNKDSFEKAGLDPETPPATWKHVIAAAQAIRASSAAAIPMTTSWPVWIQLEQFGAIHDLPYATQANGFDGLDAELLINTEHYVAQVQRLLDMAKDGTFRYGGRDNSADAMFPSGQAAMSFNSSSVRSDIARTANFRWGTAMLPYDPAVIDQPINSIIGGASLWPMTTPNRTPEEYKAVASFLLFLSQPENVASWSKNTGYVPVTVAGYELMRQQGFFKENPGADVPIEQLTRGTMTKNSMGFRLGRMAELRNIISEELERALQGAQSAQAAMDVSVRRGNRVLRDFQRTQRS
ncbi:sn-glycerol-3-phosphate ABC transporter substrate-binding protein UgpB [Aestuariivirga sp.]|uniref:sn-glycerol-3-phosphate ABC transporter substrate-binding protein UgpB n=1 Tax=Aestuariivirga sp. TaxID=2650926 RepID=UPI0025C6DAB5|nr:sn-glycerol-3-phosphate ABC transporter substrate-binding protein UgpB [Aestuariivirga sp.]MCA3555514.1 sn-glycerol-3-phosphate ABC transporter substrate-binding protein UgpB [Aestuariivirga sp.]